MSSGRTPSKSLVKLVKKLVLYSQKKKRKEMTDIITYMNDITILQLWILKHEPILINIFSKLHFVYGFMSTRLSYLSNPEVVVILQIANSEAK